MSKWDKLLSRICSLDKDMQFDELRKVLESYGYEMKRPSGGSSHCTFRKSGCNPIAIPLARTDQNGVCHDGERGHRNGGKQ